MSVYDEIGGEPVVLALAHHWHVRVLADPVVSHAFEHGFREDHTERLAAYWAEAFGGPTTFTDSMGTESEVVRIHSGNGEHDEMDRLATECFAEALKDAGVPVAHHARLTQWFEQANTYVNHHWERPEDVPEGLTISTLGQNE